MKSVMKGVCISLAAASMALLIGGKALVHAQSDEAAVPQAKASPVDLIGTWTGTNNTCNACTMELDITKQNGVGFHGTFSLETDGETPGGKLNGKFKDNAIVMTLHATMGTKHTCTAKATATLTDPNTMTGSFTVVNNAHCNGSGMFDLTRQ